ncbi:MAG: acyl carrier protein [Bacteroidales bacterium]|nr:acyl carrier protein [Bacteroidales bacterium]
MYERLLNLIKTYLPEDKIASATPDSRLLADLGMDSIGMLMLSMAMEEEFGVTFDAPVTFVTVKDVLDFLDKNATKR